MPPYKIQKLAIREVRSDSFMREPNYVLAVYLKNKEGVESFWKDVANMGNTIFGKVYIPNEDAGHSKHVDVVCTLVCKIGSGFEILATTRATFNKKDELFLRFLKTIENGEGLAVVGCMHNEKTYIPQGVRPLIKLAQAKIGR